MPKKPALSKRSASNGPPRRKHAKKPAQPGIVSSRAVATHGAFRDIGRMGANKPALSKAEGVVTLVGQAFGPWRRP